MLHALDGLRQPARELRGLVGHTLMGRQRPSVTSRMLSLVIDLVLVLLGAWLIAWVGRQTLRMVVGQ